jgi:hypothetical protein
MPVTTSVFWKEWKDVVYTGDEPESPDSRPHQDGILLLPTSD